MSEKITCSIRTYNESARIKIALGHAFKWADEVLVLDKHSTDGTADISAALGARVVMIPFTPQGHENYIENYQYGTHDWVWDFSPGDVPMRSVIESAKSVMSDAVDVIGIRHKYFSFGLHNENSPWSWSIQPRLFHRGRAIIQNVVHQHIVPTRARTLVCPGPGYVLHQTHATVPSFMRSHLDYMTAEMTSGTPDEIIARALRNAESFTGQFNAHPELLPHRLAWRIYWQGVALHAWQRKQSGDVPAEYAARAEELLRAEWEAI
jgi:hypothetical protein